MQLSRLAFRTRLLLVSASLVVLTAALMIVPLLINSRREAESIYRERLTALAHGVSASIAADTVQKLAQTSGTTIPYVVTRNVLRDFAWHRDDSLHVDTREGLFIAMRERDVYRAIAHANWPIIRPADSLVCTMPAAPSATPR